MRKLQTTLMILTVVSAPLWAGTMVLEIGNPAANAEATAKNAVLMARITACHAPEKTALTATAEGIANGRRQSIPLNIVRLSKPDTFAIAREWPESGEWVVKIVATNPEFKGYATGVLASVKDQSFDWAAVKHFFHAPTEAEVDAALGVKSAALIRH